MNVTALILGMTLMVTGCGNDSNKPAGETATAPSDAGTPGDSNNFPSFHAKDVASLPACNETISGALSYVSSEKAFYTCDAGEWAVIEIKGEDGKDGVDGKNGADGTDNRIVASIHCSGALDGTSLYFSYNASLMASGDVFANGSIIDDYFEISRSAFYSVQQVGATTAAVILANDQSGTANGGWWRLELDRKTLITSITYFDDEVVDGEISWVMTPDKCINNEYE